MTTYRCRVRVLCVCFAGHGTWTWRTTARHQKKQLSETVRKIWIFIIKCK